MLITDYRKGSGTSGGSITPGLLVTLLTLVLVQIGFGSGDIVHILNGALVDTDAYMRLNRVRLLWESGAWFDSTDPRISPPHGLVLHWTRPMDVILLAGALPLTPFLGFEGALHWWGVLVGPFLQVVFLLALLWASAPLLTGPWRWLIALFSLAQPAVLGAFVLGRPDHHGLLALWLVVAIGFTVRLLLKPERLGYAIGAGAVAAVGLWISVETLPATTLAIASLGLYWLFGDHRMARAGARYAAALFVTLLAALVVERGGSAFIGSEFDKVSGAHALLFGLNLLFWSGADVAARLRGDALGRTGRLAWAVVGGSGAGLVLWYMEPGFFGSPIAQIGEFYQALVESRQVIETHPLLPFGPGGAWTWSSAVARPIHWLGIGIPALPWLAYLIATRPGQRKAWVYLGLGALMFLSLAVSQVRWSSYAEIYVLVPYGSLAAATLTAIGERLRQPILTIVRPLMIIGLSVWFLLPTVGTKLGGETAPQPVSLGCPLKDLSRVLAAPDGWGTAPKRVMALLDFGPELMYRTPHNVFSIPNHRYQPGFAATHRIMKADKPVKAEALIRANQVDLIVLCPGPGERFIYDSGQETFYKALVRGEVPDFLMPVPLPEPLDRSFKVFSVRPRS